MKKLAAKTVVPLKKAVTVLSGLLNLLDYCKPRSVAGPGDFRKKGRIIRGENKIMVKNQPVNTESLLGQQNEGQNWTQHTLKLMTTLSTKSMT